MKPTLVDVNTLEEMFAENPPGTPVIIDKTCIECGCDVAIEIHRTSGGFGLQGGILLRANNQTVARCLACHEKCSTEFVWNPDS